MNEFLIYLLLAVILIAVVIIKLKLGDTSKKWKQEIAIKLTQLSKIENSQNPSEWKSLLIEIDKLLDYTFKKSGVRGETMGERLKNAKSKFKYSDYQNIWNAHKARNKLAHEFDYKMSISEMKAHYLVLKKSIKTLI